MFPLIDIDGVSFQDTSGSLIVWNDYKLIINFINFSYNYLPIDNFNGYFLLSLITTTHTRSLPLLTLATLELSLSLYNLAIFVLSETFVSIFNSNQGYGSPRARSFDLCSRVRGSTTPSS